MHYTGYQGVCFFHNCKNFFFKYVLIKSLLHPIGELPFPTTTSRFHPHFSSHHFAPGRLWYLPTGLPLHSCSMLCRQSPCSPRLPVWHIHQLRPIPCGKPSIFSNERSQILKRANEICKFPAWFPSSVFCVPDTVPCEYSTHLLHFLSSGICNSL